MKQSTFSAVMANSIKNLLQGYTKGIRFVAVLTMLLTMGIGQAWGAEETYEKVTSAPSDWSGEYLIVYEGGKVAFNGSLTSLDAVSNTKSVTINNNQIKLDSKYSFTITKSGTNYTIKSASGKYIGNGSNSNALTSSSTALNNTISFTSKDDITIKSSGGAYLRYNATSGQTRFRYYKSSTYTDQKAICLYKKKSAAYTFHYGEKDKSYQKIDFKQVVGTTNEWQITDFVFPDVNTNQACYVGYNGYWYNSNLGASNSKSADLYFWNMPLAKLQNDNACSSVNYLGWDRNSQNGHKVIGTLRIYDNDYRDNLAIAFVPNGYGLCYGKDGQAWSNIAFNGNDDVVTTNVITLTKEMIDGTYKYYVGLLTSDGGYSYCGNSSTLVMNTIGSYYNISWHDNLGQYSSGQAGVFRIWTNSCNGNNTPNFVCHFVPYYRVSYDLNGGNGTALPSQWYSCESGTQTITLPAKPTRDGYRFKGWGTLSVDATTYSFTPTSNVTLQAQWEKVYTVTFDLQGHGTAIPQQTVVAGGKATRPTDPTATGYDFGGWYKESACTNVFDFNTAINANTTIYAKWTAKKYTYTLNPNTPAGATVIFKDKAGSSVDKIQITQTYGEAAQSFANFYSEISCEGYRFEGWYSATSGGSKWTQTQSTPADNGVFNFYARWIKVHTITWKVNGTTHSTTTVDNGDPLVLPSPNPTAPSSCSDKVFIGWTESATIDSEGNNITYINSSTKPDGDKTYHAVFATKDDGEVVTTTDKLTRATTGIDNGSSTYSTWSGKTVTSPAVYAGNSAGSNNSIQLRSNNSNSGIVTTKSGGKVTRVSVVWNSETASGRTLNVYGKNSAYSAATDLYNSSNQGTLLGNIVYGTSTELTISGDYEYIGLRSASNAMYLTSVSITWSVGSEPTYTDYVTSCTPQYTITLNPNGGTIDDNYWIYDNGTGYYTQTVSEGTVLNFPTATKTGYTNIGWKKNNTSDAVASITASENATYTAAYDCALATVGISGTYALTVGDVFELVATAYDSNGDVLTCPANTTYSWERYNSVNEKWEAITDDNSDGDDAKLTFNNCQIANCGAYRCHVSYGECEASSHTTAADGGFNVHCFHLKGDFEGDWGIEYAFNHTDEPGIATLTLDLISGRIHNFKIYDGISQYGNGGTISTSVTDWTYGSDNNSNTILETGADGSYVFTLNYTQLINNSTNILVLDVTYPPSNQSEGYTVYYDNLVHNWQNVYYRIGHTGHNQNAQMELVRGTSHLYKCTTPEYNDFEAWQVANNVAWSGEHSIYNVNTNDQYAITHATEYKKFVVVEDITLTPDEDGTFVNGENCTYYPAAKQAGMKKHNAKIIASPTGGTITVSYTDYDGTEKSDFTSGDRDLAHTCLLTITATPDAGYSLGTLTVNDEPFTSGNVHTLVEDAVIEVVWTEKATPTFAWSDATCTAALEADNNFPTLNNPNSLSPVTYVSSNTGVATIDANGNITLVATGTTTITATGAETDTHKSATTAYTLTVNPSNCRWVEVGSDITQIVSGSELIIAMEYDGYLYALPNNGGNSAPIATSINAADILAGHADKTCIWDVTKDANDNLIFHSASNSEEVLFSNAGKDNVLRVGNPNEFTNAKNNNVFIIYSNFLVNKITLNYLGIGTTNSQSIWKTYDKTTGNLASQTLRIFQRECLDASKVWVEGNLTNVSCSPQLPQQLANDGSITLTFTAADGYVLPNDVTVTNATKTWNQETGKLTISNPTGNVMVTVEAVELHTITWMVGNNSVLTEEVANATGVTETPTDPTDDAIGDCANAFMGWTETPLGSAEGQSAPADLCTAAQMKSKHTSVTRDKTFYAVFATAITTPGTSITKEETYSHTITSQIWDATGAKMLSDVSWTLANNGGYYGYEGTKGQQVGSGSKPATSMTLTTSGFASASKITSVTINTSGASDTKAKVSVKVGGTSYLCNSNTSPSITTTATAYEFTGNSTGDIVISWSQTSSKAIYFKSITVVYSNTTTTPDVTTYSNYVTNCCAIAPATNLTVSGTTSNTATLTWTAPSPATGITKLQVRNAADDAVVVDDIAVGTTRATITGLTECTKYNYYVASVGDCEVFSNIVTAQPFSNAKTVNYDYNGGSGSPASFTTSCEKQEIVLPTATRAGYDFNGWYTAATGGTKVGDAGDTYNPTTSSITLYAQWTIKQYTITWNPNGGNWGSSTSNIVEIYEHGATLVQPAVPQRDGYRFTGWSPTVSESVTSDKTYIAQWKQNYTITFHDGDDVTPWTQTKDAESINLTEYVGTLACDDYQFAGWSTDATKYNDEPANITTWVTGNYTPTANIDLYAVYTKGAVTNDFTLNCAGGVYEIWEKGHNQHMAGRLNGGGYGFQTTEYWEQNNTESNGAPFTITKVADNTYTLQNADGQYITRDSYDEDELEIKETLENADRYKWTISNGTNGTWRFTNKAATSYALVYYNNRYFELRSASSVTAGNTTTYDLELTPAQTNVYQSNPNCGPYYIIFNTHGGEFIQGEYAYGEEQTGLTETTYSKFPAAELEGYTFAGWKDGTPQDDINYEPYLKKQGDDLVVSSNKTYHAVYYYYDEEEDIDWSKEFTTGIYADVNGTKYFLAGTPDRGTMSSTTDCGYVSEVTITPGTGANAGKYKITVNGVAMAPKTNETALVNGTYWWTITERSVGSGEYKISGQDKKNIVLLNSSWGHYTYNQGSEYGNNYYYPHFGKCLQHHWTSYPSPKPSLKLSGNIYITATNSRAIRSTETLSVVANNLSSGESITLTSNSSDIYFSIDKNFNFALGQAANQKPTTSLTLNANADGNLETEVYVHYNPSIDGDGVPTDVVVTATVSSVSKNHTIHVRDLPAKFVIATKVGATWYALPANMTGETNPLAEVIEVDETTMTATAPNTSTYTLWPVKTTNGTGNRYADYGDRLRFAAVNNEQRGLWANNNNNSSAIRNYAVINSLGADGTAAYEWKVTTTVVDGRWQYTLQTDQTQNQNYLRYWTSAEGTPVGPKWGTYNAGENKLYFLPVTETQPFEYAVVEWYPTKVLIQTDVAIASPTVKVGGEKVASPILTSKGGKLYEISNLPLETNPNKLLQVSFIADAVEYANAKVVPIILSRGAKSITGEPFATLTQKVYQCADVVVRDGATLSIDGTTDVTNTLLGVTIYPTAKVSVEEGKKLSVHSLTFFGGIDEIYNGSTYEINKYGVPQLLLKGILNKTITTMDYIMRVNLDQMYQVGVPYDVNLSDITYWDGTTMTLGDNLYVSAYDGQKRANLEPTGSWVWEVNFAEKVLKAGIGYTISADMQSGVGNEYSIIRLPMKSNIASGSTEVAKTVQVYAYANTNGVEITDNNKGWNYLSNPYMAAISGAETDSKLVVSGYLSRDDVAEPWEWFDNQCRYVTIPSDDGTYHYQQKFKDAILNPFKSFFLQIANEGTLSFELTSRQSAPARYLQTNTEKREVEFEVLLANDTRSDNLGFLIGEDYTPAYEINADLEKMIGSMSVYTIYNGYNLAYNALSPTNAAEQIPIGYVVPTVGEYTFALDESSDIEDVEHIYLIDYETSAITDLVTDVYTFTASEQKSDTRFAINVTLKSKESTVTGLVNINKDSEQSLKFIHNDKIYILHNGVIYDATGKFVETINK